MVIFFFFVLYKHFTKVVQYDMIINSTAVATKGMVVWDTTAVAATVCCEHFWFDQSALVVWMAAILRQNI